MLEKHGLNQQKYAIQYRYSYAWNIESSMVAEHEK